MPVEDAPDHGPGDADRVEAAIAEARRLGTEHGRAGVTPFGSLAFDPSRDGTRMEQYLSNVEWGDGSADLMDLLGITEDVVASLNLNEIKWHPLLLEPLYAYCAAYKAAAPGKPVMPHSAPRASRPRRAGAVPPEARGKPLR